MSDQMWSNIEASNFSKSLKLLWWLIWYNWNFRYFYWNFGGLKKCLSLVHVLIDFNVIEHHEHEKMARHLRQMCLKSVCLHLWFGRIYRKSQKLSTNYAALLSITFKTISENEWNLKLHHVEFWGLKLNAISFVADLMKSSKSVALSTLLNSTLQLQYLLKT